ncbi:MAG: hypothetical protein LBK77_00675 [Spirochaetaceae bacterium]|jgi:hypothetical protein|nr:hypothetical protein [Spirochaetaceae bacterium]
MALQKWKDASRATKIASILMALSALLSLVIGFSILDDIPMPIPGMGEIATVYVLLFFAIDVIVAIGLFFVAKWARRLTIWWAILSFLSIIPSFTTGEFSAWIVPQVVTLVSGILLLAAGKDFTKKKVKEED